MADAVRLVATSRGFDEISLAELRRRQSHKWRAYPPDVLPSFVAEMDFPLAPPVANALIAAVDEGDTGYAWASPELATALATFARTRFGWVIDPTGVVLVPDVMVGVTELLRVAANPGDGIVINTPVYPPFFSHIVGAGRRVVEAPLALTGDGYQLDVEALEHAFAGGARVYLLCNPHNPTGRVFSRAELARVADLADRYRIIVLADEIHSPLVLPGARHVSYLSLGAPATTHGIALVSASKAWNIPGLKCAQVVVASDEMRALINRLPADLTPQVGNLGVTASIAAYRDGGGWLDELLAVLDRNRALLASLLAERLPAVRYRPPEGSYLAWVDCRALGLEGEPVDVFLERGRVALGPGPRFGSLGIGFVRITMATTATILCEIVERMTSAVGPSD